MKKINMLLVLLISLILLYSPYIAHAQSVAASGIYYEPFGYDISPDNKLNAAGQGAAWWWETGNNQNASRNTAGEPVIITSGNLTYPGLESHGNKIALTGTSKMYYRRVAAAAADHQVYCSFIFNVTSLPNEGTPADGDHFVSMGNNSNDFGLVHIRRSSTSGKFNIGLRKRSNSVITWLSKDLDINTNYFLVLGARHTGTVNTSNGYYIGDSVVELWLNPTGASTEDAPDISTDDGANLNDFKTVQWVVILNNTAKNVGLTMEVDELRASTKEWADVVPFAGGGTGNRTIVTDGSLTYPGLTSSGNKISFGGAGPGYYRDISGASSTGVLYGSFLLKLTSLPATADYFIYLGNETAITATAWLRASTTPGKFNIGIAKRHILPVSWLPDELDVDDVQYVVFSYTEVPGTDNDQVRIWLNPTDFDTEPVPDLMASNGTDISTISDINRVVLDHGSAGIANARLNIELDELRVSPTWTDLTALPVRLASLNVEKRGNQSRISWITLSEDNNDYYEVQRSADGENFVFLARIEGKGTSHIKNEYVVYDREPLGRMNYYRLLQFDKDGTVTNLGDRVLSFSVDSKVTIGVYPNPVQKEINLLVKNYPGNDLKAALYTINGLKIHQENIKTEMTKSTYTLRLDTLPVTGVYMLLVTGTGGLNETVKIIIQ